MFALADADLFAILGWDLRSHFGGLHQAALELDLAVALQGPYVAALMTMDVIETLDPAEVAVEGEIARDLSEHDPVHELFEQLGMALEGGVRLPFLALAKATEFHRIVFPRGAHVVGDDVVVRNPIALVGVIPKPTHVLDLVSAVADQGVVSPRAPNSASRDAPATIPGGVR